LLQGLNTFIDSQKKGLNAKTACHKGHHNDIWDIFKFHCAYQNWITDICNCYL